MVNREMAAVQTRERLLAAAREALRTQGINGLTMENVARAAGVSKGGLLHHFRSKDALVEAILQQLFADFELRVEQYHVLEPETPGRWSRAYVRATFEDEPLPLELTVLLLSAISEDDVLIHLLRDDVRQWDMRLCSDGLPVPRARVIRQAADAYWTECLIGTEPTEASERQELMNELLTLAGGSAS